MFIGFKLFCIYLINSCKFYHCFVYFYNIIQSNLQDTRFKKKLDIFEQFSSIANKGLDFTKLYSHLEIIKYQQINYGQKQCGRIKII